MYEWCEDTQGYIKVSHSRDEHPPDPDAEHIRLEPSELKHLNAELDRIRAGVQGIHLCVKAKKEKCIFSELTGIRNACNGIWYYLHERDLRTWREKYELQHGTQPKPGVIHTNGTHEPYDKEAQDERD